jgi:hypothetical protein
LADQKPPFVDPKVVAWLATLFPDKCPRPSDTDREIWMAVGAQGVIKKTVGYS